LLDLPRYGVYQHSYEEMLAAHAEFMSLAKDRLRVLNLGGSIAVEAHTLYRTLASSPVPLNEEDRTFLAELAIVCLDDQQPEKIPVRENRALLNMVRVNNGRDPIVTTPTDILRLACALSQGDVTLEKNTKFASFARPVRRLLMSMLDRLIGEVPAKLADIGQYAEQWKRLGERLHPHEYMEFPNALDVFAVARGDKKAVSIMGQAEAAFARRDYVQAATILARSPGLLMRSLDRLFSSASAGDVPVILESVRASIGSVAGRVILSAREHFANRLTARPDARRIFAGSSGKAWVASELRAPLPSALITELFGIFDAEMFKRLGVHERLVVDRTALGLALPLSEKNKASGFGIMPRGSVLPLTGQHARFFMYWKQKSEPTDLDLSAIFLNQSFETMGHVSYTSLQWDGVVHSGDIRTAPNGASEFIDISLGGATYEYVMPQVNYFSGEQFDEVKESFFGFMERTPAQRGKPFEAATVQTKSELRGKGKIALPLVFVRGAKGEWSVKWLHLYLKGQKCGNRVEKNRLSTALLVRSVVEREYLTVSYLADLLARKAGSFAWYEGQTFAPNEPVTFIGLVAPEGLPPGSTVITPANLASLIPA
jgi:hypothetical protein